MNSINAKFRNTKFKRNLVFLATFLIITSSFFHYASSVNAAGSLWDQQGSFSTDVGQVYGGGGAPADIRVVVVEIIRVVLGFLAIIFVILIIVAGFRWMTAAGNEEQVKEAIKQIRNAVIGLLIILISYSITVFVMKVLTDKMLRKM